MKGSRIIHGEALEWIRGMDSGSIGMVCSDPPFFTGIGRDDGKFGADPWVNITSIEAAASWAEPLMLELRRVTRKGGAIVVMAGVHANAAWMTAAERVGLAWMAELIVLWNKGKPRSRNFGSLHTHILWFTVPGSKHCWNWPKKAIYSSILCCKKVPRTHRIHPAQKPVELTTFLISVLSKSEDVILDPFCGSGSTLVSAVMCNREYVGIDRDDKYCQIARKRTINPELEDEEDILSWCNGRLEKM